MVRLTEMLAGEPDVRVAGALDAFALGLRDLALGKIGQLEIVEEQVDELVAAEHEAEGVLAVAFAGPEPLALPWPERCR